MKAAALVVKFAERRLNVEYGVEGLKMIRKKQRGTIMKKLIVLVAAIAAAAEYYKLQDVRRIDKDLYRSGELLIETRYCYHYTYGETAVLKYEGPGSYDNKIIWEDDSNCMVKTVAKR